MYAILDSEHYYVGILQANVCDEDTYVDIGDADPPESTAYQYVDGKWVLDSVRQAELIEQQQTEQRSADISLEQRVNEAENAILELASILCGGDG